jgi:hypothetical protein
MVSDSVTEADCAVALESVSWKLSELLLAVDDGVPVIAPVDASSETPDGNEPFVSDHLYGAVPPLAASVAAYAFPTVPGGRPVVVMVRGPGDVGFEGGGELPDGGSAPCWLVVVELPPQPPTASAISAIDTSTVVVAFPCRIVLAPSAAALRR